MTEPTGTFGLYGTGPWYLIEVHTPTDTCVSRFATREERDARVKELRAKPHPSRVVVGDDESDREYVGE